MTVSDLTRIFEDYWQAAVNEKAEEKLLSRARLAMKKRLDEVEGGIYDTDREIG